MKVDTTFILAGYSYVVDYSLLTFTLPEVFYDVIMPYAIHINNVIFWGLKPPYW